MKKYGIRCTLPSGDTMSLAHLLGPDWESAYWYDDQRTRDQRLREMRERHRFYRNGDAPRVNYEPIERDL